MRLLPSLTSGASLLSLTLLSGYCQTVQAARKIIFLCVTDDPNEEAYEATGFGCNRNWGENAFLKPRTAYLYVPDGIKGREDAPLVMNLHAAGSNGLFQQKYSRFDETADKNGFVVLYPEGISHLGGELENLPFDPKIPQFPFLYTWNAGGCCSYDPVDDIGFLKKLIEYVKKGEGMINEVKVDEERIYVTGMSNGGFMTNRVACEMSDIIAAASPVAGPLMEKFDGGKHPFGWKQDENTEFTCDPTSPVPLLHIHSTQDNVVPFLGSANVIEDDVNISDAVPENLKNKLEFIFNFPLPDFVKLDVSGFMDFLENHALRLLKIQKIGFPSVESSVAAWRRINNVMDTATITEFGGGITKDLGTECKTYNEKKPRSKNYAPVELCEINSTRGLVGHCWPGTGLGQCENDGVNNQYIWDFFSKYKKVKKGDEAISIAIGGKDEL